MQDLSAHEAVVNRNRVGTLFRYAAIPPVIEDTRFLDVGPVTIGVEYRYVDGEHQHPQEGVSLHIYDSRSNDEYVRFDCFDEGPHYHYLRPEHAPGGVANVVVPIDVVAVGDPFEWALQTLATRLHVMLTAAGAPPMPVPDERAVSDAVDEVRVLAARAIESRRAMEHDGQRTLDVYENAVVANV